MKGSLRLSLSLVLTKILPVEIGAVRHASLTSKVGHNAAGDILAAIRKAPVKLKSGSMGSRLIRADSNPVN